MLRIGYPDAGWEAVAGLPVPVPECKKLQVFCIQSVVPDGRATYCPMGHAVRFWLPPAAKGAASASPPVYRAEYQELLNILPTSQADRPPPPIRLAFKSFTFITSKLHAEMVYIHYIETSCRNNFTHYGKTSCRNVYTYDSDTPCRNVLCS